VKQIAFASGQQLTHLVKEHCGGQISCSMLDRDDPWAVME